MPPTFFSGKLSSQQSGNSRKLPVVAGWAPSPFVSQIHHLQFAAMRTPDLQARLSSSPKARSGCLGCLGQMVWQAAVVLLLGAVLIVALTGLFYPWAFYLGGKFHIIPYWQGWGKLHAKSGDYALFVRFEPTPRGSRIIARSNLKGVGYLCTPRGERFFMHLGGSMRPHLNLSTDGEAIGLYMDNWSGLYTQFSSDHRPSIQLRGHWQNPNLVMDDDSSIFRAFRPDGTVYRARDPSHPYHGEVVPITLVNGPYSDFDRACAAIRH
jgi:hypothetical protein